jgi:hypothetical protein
LSRIEIGSEWSGSDIRVIGSGAFGGVYASAANLTVPPGRSIAFYATSYAYNTSLGAVVLEADVTGIGVVLDVRICEYPCVPPVAVAPVYCFSCDSCSLPNDGWDPSEPVIPANTFRYCSGLVSLVIPEGVVAIEAYAFADTYGKSFITASVFGGYSWATGNVICCRPDLDRTPEHHELPRR